VSMLDKALAALARGWYVFPCNGKIPIEEGGFKTASNNEARVREWWTAYPKANPGVWPGGSLFTSVDIDTGLTNEASLREFCARYGLPETFALRTGKRPQFRVQLLFSGNTESFNRWQVDDFAGDVRGSWGHVMAPGSIHPESGAPYEILWDKPLAPLPDWVKQLQPVRKQREIDPTAPIVEWRNDTLYRVLCGHRSRGADDEMVRQFAYRAVAQMPNPLDDEEVERVITNALKQPIGLPEPVPVIGTEPAEKTFTDWRELFHTRDEIINCQPPTFLIDQFLARESICALAAPVAQRKSLIALNVARSLCTGAPLFGYLEVKNKPSRVLYLCPEMGLISLSDRIRRIGLESCLGESLFLRSMNKRALDLLDIPDDALRDSVLIIDTAIRFLKGDEQSSTDMKVFSETLFTVQRRQGPEGAILALYHSPKTTKDTTELTLENCLRGSGELGAAVTDAHGTRLQDPSDPYKSLSYISHIKPRDYKGLDGFEVSSDQTGLLTAVGDPAESKAVLSVRKSGVQENADGQDDAARAVVKAALKNNPKITVPQLLAILYENGIERRKTWVTNLRLELRGTGVKHISDG
jgi:Bifunctional DNA primase/polymerase, N-terminal/AAA domain